MTNDQYEKLRDRIVDMDTISVLGLLHRLIEIRQLGTGQFIELIRPLLKREGNKNV